MVPFLLSLAFAQECPPGDCDGDGFTIEQGDCNDDDASIFPGRLEDCGNDRDDNCDGLYNEGCDRSVTQGQLRGGSTCAQPADTAVLFLPALLWRRRRR